MKVKYIAPFWGIVIIFSIFMINSCQKDTNLPDDTLSIEDVQKFINSPEYQSYNNAILSLADQVEFYLARFSPEERRSFDDMRNAIIHSSNKDEIKLLVKNISDLIGIDLVESSERIHRLYKTAYANTKITPHDVAHVQQREMFTTRSPMRKKGSEAELLACYDGCNISYELAYEACDKYNNEFWYEPEDYIQCTLEALGARTLCFEICDGKYGDKKN